MHTQEYEFAFDELPLLKDGLLAYGTALLVDAGDGYEGEWLVESIVLDGGQLLKRHGNGTLGSEDKFLDMLFERIAGQIENDKCPIGRAAAGEWADFLDGNAPVSVSSVFKPRKGMPLVFGASMGESR
jgi:hypothetical protein